MNNDDRPDPDALLEAIQREENKSRKGRLKIFLGMAAGVGKTYAMLEAAQKQRRNGVDVVVASIDSHGREETKQLLDGLTLVPEKWLNYRDTVFEELDLDKIIALKPQIVIVDELAHSNVPGSRHPKRWQDVVEILENGIDVYTTLNVQHIESLKDVIESIAGIVVRETVPDSLIEAAASIELIDLTPEELLQRLKEGKVYFPEQTEIATKHFFQEDRLTALREILLRYAAKKIDHDLHGMISTVERPQGWKLHDRLLVALGPNLHSQKLIRTTRRLAFNLDAPWIALYVDDGKELSSSEQALLSKNLALARDLGAEVMTTHDPDIAEAIERIARQKGVTQIVIGRSPKKGFFRLFAHPIAYAEKLAREYSDIDIYIVRQTRHDRVEKKRWFFRFFSSQISSYFLVFCFVCLLASMNGLLVPYLGYKVVGFVFLLGLLFLSLFFKKGPIFFASLLYVFIWDYFFISPTEYSIFGSKEDNALLLLYVLTAVVVGILIDRAREHKELLIKREESTRALYEIVRDIASAPSSKEILKSVKERLGTLLNGTCEIFLKDIYKGLSFEGHPVLLEDEKEKNALLWVFENGKEAGWSTNTLSGSKNFYIPLKGFNDIVGVLLYRPKILDRELLLDEKNLLYTVAQQLANYHERSLTEQKSRQIEYLNKIEKTHQTILKLLSDEFQKPLVNIQEAIHDLKDEDQQVEMKTEVRQLRKIERSSERLSQILANISAMSKLSTGLVPIRKDCHSVTKLIEAACEDINKSINSHQLKIIIQEDLPLISCDFSLMELLLYNLINNAVKYSPEKSTVEIEAKRNDDYIIFSVSDQGKGIPKDRMDKIFEMFYRLPGTATEGMGLGLSIAKTIAEIHHGYLLAENRKVGGAKFSLFLPI